jgi:rare lipoprotein A
MQGAGGSAGLGLIVRRSAGRPSVLRLAVVAVAGLTLANCSQTVDPKLGVSASARVVEPGQPVPKGGGVYRVGKPYTIAGRTYVPQENVNYRAEGMASWYGDDFHGRYTANGEIFDMNSITAAHPTLPLPSYVRVTNLRNKRSLIVRVNDRGPYAHNRLIDLSSRSAKLLGFSGHGLAPVRVEYVGRAPLAGSDDLKLMATLRIDGHPAKQGVGDERAYARNDARQDRDQTRDDERDEPKADPRREAGVKVASAGAYAPEFFDSRPMNRIGNVPEPRERPYSLGEGGAAPRPAVTAQALPAPAPKAPPVMARLEPPAYRATSPVTAYAPVRYDGSAGFVSGRGLY